MSGNSATLISRAEYARRKGWSRAYVTQLVQKGRLALVDGKIDPRQAEAQLQQSSDPSHPKAKQSSQPISTENTPVVSARREPRFTQTPTQDTKMVDFNTARTMKEAFRAKITKMEYEILCRDYVLTADVKRDAFEAGRTVRNRLLTLPPRLAPLLAHQTDQKIIEKMLKEAIQEALEVLTRSKY